MSGILAMAGHQTYDVTPLPRLRYGKRKGEERMNRGRTKYVEEEYLNDREKRNIEMIERRKG